MELKYKSCSGCGFSYKNEMNGYKVGIYNFCSSACVPKCGGCNSNNPILYCNTNHEYYCISCEQQRCKYCNAFKKGSKCFNKCE